MILRGEEARQLAAVKAESNAQVARMCEKLNAHLDSIHAGFNISFDEVEKMFADPGKEFRPAPLWTWNARVTHDDIDRMLADFKDQGFGGAFIHPRPGIETEYLSEEWFELWRYSVEKGKELGLDIWIYDEKAKTVKNITNNEAQDIMPMWIGDEIYFISDRDHTMNIFVYNTKSGQTSKVTNFTDYDVKFPTTNGKMIVFEKGGYLYRLDPTTKQAVQINVTMNAEGVYARAEQKKMNEEPNITQSMFRVG